MWTMPSSARALCDTPFIYSNVMPPSHTRSRPPRPAATHALDAHSAPVRRHFVFTATIVSPSAKHYYCRGAAARVGVQNASAAVSLVLQPDAFRLSSFAPQQFAHSANPRFFAAPQKCSSASGQFEVGVVELQKDLKSLSEQPAAWSCCACSPQHSMHSP
jgi:hypothetical protein